MKKYSVGVDIGGTTVKLGLFGTDGEILKKWQIVTRKENEGAFILADVAGSIREILNERKISFADVEGIGMGVPGPVDENGYVERCVNLGWKDIRPAEKMKELLPPDADLKIAVGNDANVAALGEQWLGGAKGYQSSVMVTLGTGVGGGVILNGKMIAGSHGVGGEIGHITVNPAEEDQCNCGNHGCLEQYASATGVVRIAKKILEEREKNGKKESALRAYGHLSAKDVFDCAKRSDEAALEAVEVLGNYLGLALSFISLTIDPDVFVIGGGVSKAGPILTDVIGKYYHKYVTITKKHAQIVLATLENDAGICGAARLVME